MKRLYSVLFAVILIVGVANCGATVHKNTAIQWLDSMKMGKSSPYNVTGNWKGPSGGLSYIPYRGYVDTSFGAMMLIQDGTTITGTYNEYDLIGTIGEEKVFLVAVYDEVVYYTWHLRYLPDSDAMTGKMCDGYYPSVESHCTNLNLVK
ncbi:hypothetical protein ACFL4G_01810 [Thermodesulfobacteriota bacterium]